MKKTILMFLALVVSNFVNADWIMIENLEADGVYYQITLGSSRNYAKVIHPMEYAEFQGLIDTDYGDIPIEGYVGDIVISPMIEYEGSEIPVTEIGNGAFRHERYFGGGDWWESVSSVSIPNSVTTIGDEAFADCPCLTTIEIPSSVVQMGKGVFQNCSYLNSVTLPSGISRLGERTFSGCGRLTTIIIPEQVMEIDDEAFLGCRSLTKVVVPNSVMKIHEEAFSGCSALQSVVLSSKLSEIGSMAFYGCDKLKEITALGKRPAAIQEDVFPNRSIQTLFVPVGCTSAYEAADYWWQFKEILETGAQPGIKEGDVNGDGKVNVTDIMRIVNIILNTNNP